MAYISTHETKQRSRGKPVKTYAVVYRAKVRTDDGRIIDRLRHETHAQRGISERYPRHTAVDQDVELPTQRRSIVDLRHLSAPPRPTHRYRPQRCRESGCRRARDAALSRCLHGRGSRHPRGLITHRRSSNDYLMVTTGQACRGVRRRSESTCLNCVFADFSARSTIRRSRGPW